jgi:hypothetical protein
VTNLESSEGQEQRRLDDFISFAHASHRPQPIFWQDLKINLAIKVFRPSSSEGGDNSLIADSDLGGADRWLFAGCHFGPGSSPVAPI